MSKKYAIFTLSIVSILLILCMFFTFICDPLFHYHEPMFGIKYQLNSPRYMNNGILRNFNYNAIINGTSMVENFKTSECDEIFDVCTVKVPISGASLQEQAMQLETAFNNNHSIEMVIWGLDYNKLDQLKDYDAYPNKPYYLYDDDYFNDVQYLLNKNNISSSIHNIRRTMKHEDSTSFDAYTSWHRSYGKNAVLSTYEREKEKNNSVALSQKDKIIIDDNIKQNVTTSIEQNPNTTFYLFFTPYSIIYWDANYMSGNIDRQIDIEKYVIEKLLHYPNVKLYSFFKQTDIICNLDYYSDSGHYISDVNSMILNWIKKDTGLMTPDNYLHHIEWMKEFYNNYKYDEIFLK